MAKRSSVSKRVTLLTSVLSPDDTLIFGEPVGPRRTGPTQVCRSMAQTGGDRERNCRAKIGEPETSRHTPTNQTATQRRHGSDRPRRDWHGSHRERARRSLELMLFEIPVGDDRFGPWCDAADFSRNGHFVASAGFLSLALEDSQLFGTLTTTLQFTRTFASTHGRISNGVREVNAPL